MVQAIKLGATYELAASFAGIAQSTFYDYLNRYSEFSEAVKAAEGIAAVGWLAKIENAANEGTWQAAAWKLERRYPQQYGKTVQEVQGKDGGPIVVEGFDYNAAIANIAPRPGDDSTPSGED